MDKKVKKILFPLLFGIVGLILRFFENMEFDYITELPVPSALHLVSAVWVVLSLILIFILRWKKEPLPENICYEECFALRNKRTSFLMILGIAMLLAEAAWFLWKRIAEGLTVGNYVTLVLFLLTLGSEGYMAICCRKKKSVPPVLSLSALLLLTWIMILHYVEVGSNPVLLNYYVEVIALASILFQFYFRADFLFQRPRIRRFEIANGCGIAFSLMVLTDTERIVTPLFYGAIVLLSLAQELSLLSWEETGQEPIKLD